ncbi:MAG: hypothetical protein IJ733_19665 [Lachnospiraceae bacterium]|nr:hypothetical protein [Lachnospiraceae bacterium]
MDTKSEGVKSQMYAWLLEEILDAQSMGVSVSVDGENYSVEDVARLHGVMEDHYYMKSYVTDRSGKIVQIDFDQIIGV